MDSKVSDNTDLTKIHVDTFLYSADVILKTCYVLSEFYHLETENVDGLFSLTVKGLNTRDEIELFKKKLFSNLFDYSLREKISVETKTMRDHLVRGAIAGFGRINQ